MSRVNKLIPKDSCDAELLGFWACPLLFPKQNALF